MNKTPAYPVYTKMEDRVPLVANFLSSMRGAALALTLALSGAAQAQSVYWDFATANPTSGVPSGVSVGAVSQGNNNGTTTMLGITSASSGYTGASGTNNAGAAARTGVLNTASSGSAYFEFTVTPNSGFSFSITSISFGSRSTSTGPVSFSLRSSADSYGSDLTTGTLGTNNSAWTLRSSTGLSISRSAATTYRIYGYGGTGTPSANTANWRIDDLTVAMTASGAETTPAAPTISSPSSITTTGFTANWAASSGATKYYLDVATDSGFTSLVSGFNNLDAGNVTSYAVTGLSPATTYYYRVRASNSAGTSSNSQNQVALTSSLSAPGISVSPTSLTGLSYNGNGPSTAQSVSVTASNLTGAPGALSVAGSANYEVSTTDATSGFGTSVLLNYTNATLDATNVWIRLKANLAAGNYNAESITISGGGAATAGTVTASGSVSKPTISFPATNLGSFTGTNGLGSAPKTNTVTGTNLLGDITIVATNYFEVSGDAGVTYTTNLVLTPTAGVVSNAVLFRIATNAPVGSLGTNLVTLSSPQTTNRTVQVAGTVVNGGVTISIAGANTATVAEGGTPLTLDVTLNPAAPAGGVTVSLTTNDADSSELDLSAASVTFAQGESSKTVTLTPKMDNIFDSTQTIVITAAATDWSVAGTVSVAVTNVDAAPAPTISFGGSSYTQNFDSMTSPASSGAMTASTMTDISYLSGGGSGVSGWYVYGTGWSGSANKWLGSDIGTNNAGGFRQLIDNASPLGRALGSLASSSAEGYFGLVLRNTSGKTLDKAVVVYDAVMNRNPTTTANNYPMSYLVSSTAVNSSSGGGSGTFAQTNGWSNIIGFTTPASGTGAPNATQAAISPLFKIATVTNNLTGLNWSNGTYLYIRWKETDEGGTDATAGVDNFSITIPTLPAPTISSVSPASVDRGSADTPVTFTGTGYSSPETTVSLGGNVLPLSNVTSVRLTATLSSNSLTAAGTLTLTLANPSPGGGSVSTNITVVTPVPTIVSLSPASVVSGAGDTLLTVTGTGFFSDSVVRWDGMDLATSYNSPTQLTATIPAANLASVTMNSVTVATPDVGGGTKQSSESVFTVSSPTVPQLNLSGTLSGFEAPVGAASVAQIYTLQGKNLTLDVLVTAPDQFQISRTNDSGFGQTLNLTASEVNAGLALYVRYYPSVASSSHSGSITHSSDGAVTQSVPVNGNSQPSLSVVPSSVSFQYSYKAGDQSGMNADTPAFMVSGARLVGAVTVAAPLDYGVSVDGVNFLPSVTLNPDASGLVSASVTVQFQPLNQVTTDKSISVTAGSLSASVSANGRAAGLVDNKSLREQPRDSQVTLSWASSGEGSKVVVLAKLGSTLTDVPANLDSLTASTVYGQGSLVGSSYVVYKENQIAGELTPSEKVTITGLTNGQQYTFKVFVVSGDAASSGSSVTSIPFADLSNVLTQWTFNSNPADALTNTGTLSPSTGTGTASLIGITTTPAYFGGSMTDPLGSAGALTGGNNSGLSYAGANSGIVPNKSAGVQIAVSTVGKKDIVIYWDNIASDAGPKHLRAQYTLDVTAATPVWQDYVATTDGLNVANAGLYEAQAGSTWYIRRKADLTGVTGVADNAKFGFRLVAAFAPGESGYRRADGTSTSALSYFSGNFRTDMLTVSGTTTTQTPFDSWASGYGLSGASAAGTADPDNDGMDNNAEFAFGTSPVSGASRAATLSSGTGTIKLTWLQRNTGVNYTVKSLPDLTTAFDSGTTVSAAPTNPQPGGVPANYTQYEASVSSSGTRSFLRVKAVAP